MNRVLPLFAPFQVVKEFRKHVGKKRALRIKAEPDMQPAAKIRKPEMNPDQRSLLLELVQNGALLPTENLYHFVQCIKSFNKMRK